MSGVSQPIPWELGGTPVVPQSWEPKRTAKTGLRETSSLATVQDRKAGGKWQKTPGKLKNGGEQEGPKSPGSGPATGVLVILRQGLKDGPLENQPVLW